MSTLGLILHPERKTAVMGSEAPKEMTEASTDPSDYEKYSKAKAKATYSENTICAFRDMLAEKLGLAVIVESVPSQRL